MQKRDKAITAITTPNHDLIPFDFMKCSSHFVFSMNVDFITMSNNNLTKSYMYHALSLTKLPSLGLLSFPTFSSRRPPTCRKARDLSGSELPLAARRRHSPRPRTWLRRQRRRTLPPCRELPGCVFSGVKRFHAKHGRRFLKYPFIQDKTYLYLLIDQKIHYGSALKL